MDKLACISPLISPVVYCQEVMVLDISSKDIIPFVNVTSEKNATYSNPKRVS